MAISPLSLLDIDSDRSSSRGSPLHEGELRTMPSALLQKKETSRPKGALIPSVELGLEVECVYKANKSALRTRSIMVFK